MKITVIGLGLIGGSLAIDLREKDFATEIIGVDCNEEHRRQARNRGLADRIETLEKALRQPDPGLVILAIPVDAIVSLLPKVLDLVGPEVTVTDMGSTKAAITASVEKHPKRAQYVASHPMAGTENSGPAAAIAGLFRGRTTVICDAEKSAAFALRTIDRMYEVLRMRKIYMNSADHDLHTAYISHVSHITSFVLADTVLDIAKDVKTIFDLAGGGFESTVRLAKSSPEMWQPIFKHNQQHLVTAVRAYIEKMQGFLAKLEGGEWNEIRDFLTEANEIKRVLAKIGGRGAP
ncbi:MAG: prephenate dehydrogenase [Bdellovibrio sp.]|nr:MAG: prephenate dehydrogenase [Bdellovibrio sp.]